MRRIKLFSACLFVVCLPLLLVSLNVAFLVNADFLYEYGFEKYDVPGVTGIEREELNRAADELVDYFNGSRDSPQIRVIKDGERIDLFSQREVDHLRDVKGIIQFFYLLLGITLGYTLIFLLSGFLLARKAFLRPMMKGVLSGGILTLTVFAVVGLWAAIDFDSLFLRFHLTGFQNDLWQLDPSTDYLIMMFPEGFFSDAALFLIGDTLLETFILIAVSWLCLRRIRPAQAHEAQLPEEQPPHEVPPPTGMDTPVESRAKDANVDINRSAS